MIRSIPKVLVWGIIRIGIAYIALNSFVTITIITDILIVNLQPLLYLQVVVLTSVILTCIALWLLKRYPHLKRFSYMMIFSVYGVIMVIAFREAQVTIPFMPFSIRVYSFILFSSFCLAALYFVFPIKKAEFVLTLLPITGGVWFLFNTLYYPLSITYDIFIGPHDAFAKVGKSPLDASMLPQLYLYFCIRGAFALGTVLLYFLVKYGHNPKETYLNLKQRWPTLDFRS